MGEYQLRRARPGETFGYTDAEGRQVTLQADDEGVVEPTNPQEVALLDGYGLTVARKAEAARKDEPAAKGGE